MRPPAFAGGRLGLTAWRPNEGLHAVYAAFAAEDPLRATAEEWGREDRLRELLGDAFELEVQERVWWLQADSAEDAWKLMSNGAPPVKALVDSLEADRRAVFRDAMVEYWSQFQTGVGVREPRECLLVLGRRR